MGWVGLCWVGLGWVGLGWDGLGRVGLGFPEMAPLGLDTGSVTNIRLGWK